MQSIRNSQAASKRGQGQAMGGQRSSNMTSSSSSSDPPSSSGSAFQGPLVLTPVSQLPNAPRRNSRAFPRPEGDPKGMAFDPEHYNPDGSLRTMHRMPGFDQSYAQAMNARYIRHSKPLDRERELSVKDIFNKK